MLRACWLIGAYFLAVTSHKRGRLNSGRLNTSVYGNVFWMVVCGLWVISAISNYNVYILFPGNRFTIVLQLVLILCSTLLPSILR